MSLRDREPKPAKTRRSYRIEEIFDALPADEREILEGWLRDERYSPERIKDELDDEGLHISEGAIARYRSKVLGIGKRKR